MASRGNLAVTILGTIRLSYNEHENSHVPVVDITFKTYFRVDRISSWFERPCPIDDNGS